MSEDNRKEQQEKKDELTEKDLDQASGGGATIPKEHDGTHVYHDGKHQRQ